MLFPCHRMIEAKSNRFFFSLLSCVKPKRQSKKKIGMHFKSILVDYSNEGGIHTPKIRWMLVALMCCKREELSVVKMHDHFTLAGLMSRTSLFNRCCCYCFLCLVAVVWMGCYLKCIRLRYAIFDCGCIHSLFGCVWVCVSNVITTITCFCRIIIRDIDSSNKKS